VVQATQLLADVGVNGAALLKQVVDGLLAAYGATSALHDLRAIRFDVDDLRACRAAMQEERGEMGQET
jgi:hypothetical protein